MIRQSDLTLIALWLALSTASLGCGDTLGRVGSYQFGQDITQDSGAQKKGLWDENSEEGTATQDLDSDVEAEQELLEDPAALSTLIASKLAEMKEPQTPAGPYLSAHQNTLLDADACLARLEKTEVSYTHASFDTPLVETPLLLDGPVSQVEIRPRWPRKEPVNEVVDCHLALALLEMSRVAQRHGISKLQYYSTYRPLVVPKGECPPGKKGSTCRNKKRELKALKNKHGSQHRRALAIDIRWVVLEDGRRLDVLEDFDRRDGTPPCDYKAEWDDARILQDFMCDIYDARLFNVMLTPNANKSHHNHFHFALTPGADWYILR